MARIPPAELERLKAEVSIERLAQARGMKLVRKGRDLFTRCFLGTHGDSEASLSISPGKNLWHCLGCGAGGSVVDFVMKAEGVSFAHAVQLLRADVPAAAGGTSVAAGRAVKHSTVPKMPGLASVDADDRELLRSVVEHYHQELKQSPEALAYLKSRGIGDPEAVETFRLGFANRTLGYRIPQKNRLDGDRIRGRLQALGVIRENGREHLRGSLVFPIFDPTGNVVQMYGRKVAPKLKPGIPKHLYLSGPLRGVWNRVGLEGSREVILCESLIDALTFWCAGFRNVTTAYGVNGVPPELWEDFRHFGTERVLVAFDRDKAGERAAAALVPELTKAGLDVFRIQFPNGMDANEYAGKVTPARKSLDAVIRGAVWLGKGEGRGRRRSAERAGGILREEGTRATPDDAVSAGDAGWAATKEGRESEPAAEGAESVPEPEATVRESASLVGESPGGTVAGAASDAGETPAESEARQGESVEAVASSFSPSSDPRPAPALALSLPSATGPDLPSLAAPPVATRAAESTREAHAASPSPAAPTVPPSAPAPIPPASPASVLERRDGDLWMRAGDRSYRVQGLEKNPSPEALKVKVLVTRPDGRFHLDTVDLGLDRPRQVFVKRASEELGMQEETIHREVGRLLLALEAEQAETLRQKQTPPAREVALSDGEREEAMALLRASDLLDQVLRDFARVGVVGETTNKLVGYLAAVSRKLENPLAILIQSSSAAGKSSLMEAVLAFIPEEERVAYSAMTGQALFYMKDQRLTHKILAVAEEEGAQRASYALKLLQSEGVLVIAATGKDPATGKLVTHEYRVEGPVMLFLTTTAIDIDPELQNRCLILTVDEGREQTQAIHREQRRRQTLEGVLERHQRARILRRHQNAQRMLRPLLVVNPFAEELTFLDHQTRCRRDHMKYLTLIHAIALLHQFQREVKTARTEEGETVEYIEATREDVATADRLMREILGATLDQMPTQTRRLLCELSAWVEGRSRELGIQGSEFRFTRRDVREWSGLGNTQLKMHLKLLEEMEYLLVHAGSRGHSLVYELTYAGRPEAVAQETDTSTGGTASRPSEAASRVETDASRPQVSGKSGQVGGWSVPAKRSRSRIPSATAPTLAGETPKNAYRGNGERDPGRSDAPPVHVAAAAPGRESDG